MAVRAHKREHVILAECLPADTAGKAVYFRGPASGGMPTYYGTQPYGVARYGLTPFPVRYQVATADPRDYSKMPAFGLLVTKLDVTECLVQIRGPVHGVLSGMTPGKIQFVGDGGSVVETPPIIDVPKFIQSLGIAWSDDVFGVNPDTTLTLRRP
jgi:hypothetical protein